MFIQTLSKIYLGGIPAVITATYLVKGKLGRKWTQVLGLLIASFLLYCFLLNNLVFVSFM